MPLNNFGVSGTLWRCAQPDSAGVGDLDYLGADSIFKLNTECPEEKVWATTAGIQLVESPIPTLSNSVADVRRVVELLRKSVAAGITVVHCEHGRDRTGLIVGAYRLIYCGASFAEVQTERALYGVTGLYSIFDAEITAVLSEIATAQGSK